MATPTEPAVVLTIGQSLMPRSGKWVIAISTQLVLVALTAAYVLYAVDGGPSFFTSVPWRLALVLACGAYLNVLFLVYSYAVLYLPSTPMAVVKKTTDVGMVVGGAVMCVVFPVMAFHVKDTRVLAACTAVVAVIIVGLVAFWVRLVRTYGGDAAEFPSGGVARRLPV